MGSARGAFTANALLKAVLRLQGRCAQNSDGVGTRSEKTLTVGAEGARGKTQGEEYKAWAAKNRAGIVFSGTRDPRGGPSSLDSRVVSGLKAQTVTMIS